MKFEELKRKTASELKSSIVDLRQEQFNLRMQRAQGQLTQTHQFQVARRNIARAKMALGTKG